VTIPHWIIALAIFAIAGVFIAFAFRQGEKVKPDRNKDPMTGFGTLAAVVLTLAFKAEETASLFKRDCDRETRTNEPVERFVNLSKYSALRPSAAPFLHDA
jgi:hypothetical protein